LYVYYKKFHQEGKILQIVAAKATTVQENRGSVNTGSLKSIPKEEKNVNKNDDKNKNEKLNKSNHIFNFLITENKHPMYEVIINS
jgi:hypothetical protein